MIRPIFSTTYYVNWWIRFTHGGLNFPNKNNLQVEKGNRRPTKEFSTALNVLGNICKVLCWQLFINRRRVLTCVWSNLTRCFLCDGSVEKSLCANSFHTLTSQFSEFYFCPGSQPFNKHTSENVSCCIVHLSEFESELILKSKLISVGC